MSFKESQLFIEFPCTLLNDFKFVECGPFFLIQYIHFAVRGGCITLRHPFTPLCKIIWRSCDRASLMYSFKYNQQAATLYNILYYYQCSTCFRRFLRPSSGAQNCTQQKVYVKLASGSSKQAWHIPDAVCRVLGSWWLAEKPPETCRALTVIKNIV
jgi:hypothetical protein